jgi:hypothetical protein
MDGLAAFEDAVQGPAKVRQRKVIAQVNGAQQLTQRMAGLIDTIAARRTAESSRAHPWPSATPPRSWRPHSAGHPTLAESARGTRHAVRCRRWRRVLRTDAVRADAGRVDCRALGRDPSSGASRSSSQNPCSIERHRTTGEQPIDHVGHIARIMPVKAGVNPCAAPANKTPRLRLQPDPATASFNTAMQQRNRYFLHEKYATPKNGALALDWFEV